MARVGDVVRGYFATADATLADHHSVVVAVSGSDVMLVYTSSVKPDELGARRRWSDEFSAQDRAQAGWKVRCRYDASRVSLVPADKVVVSGQVTSSTLAMLQTKVAECSKRGEIDIRRFHATLPVEVTGHVSRQKREMAYAA